MYLHRGSRSTKFDCRVREVAKQKYITTPFYALGCKFEEMQTMWSSLTKVPAGNGAHELILEWLYSTVSEKK